MSAAVCLLLARYASVCTLGSPEYNDVVQFPFKEKKTAQSAAYLVWRHGGSCDYYTLIKLLYLSDRAALVDNGAPITGDHMCSLKWGPILSETMDRLNNSASRRGAGEVWNRYLSTRDDANQVRLVFGGEPEVGQLSEYDLDILDAIDDEHGAKTFTEFVEFCHHLPEFRDPGDSMLPIDAEDILVSEGKTAEDIHRIAEEAQALVRAAGLAEDAR